MKVITYVCTQTNVPHLPKDSHLKHSRGYAYDTGTHYIHFFGRGLFFYYTSVNVAVTEKKSGQIEDWVIKVFGAKRYSDT